MKFNLVYEMYQFNRFKMVVRLPNSGSWKLDLVLLTIRCVQSMQWKSASNTSAIWLRINVVYSFGLLLAFSRNEFLF